MTRTANATYPDKIACLIWLAAEAGHPFSCGICGKPVLPGQKVQFDHGQAVSRGGANTYQDIRPVHAAARGTADGQGNRIDCHDSKTFRPRGGATTLGGDNYEAKKTARLAESHAVHKPPPGAERAQSTSRQWPRRPLQGRAKPWPPRGSRPMNRKRRA